MSDYMKEAERLLDELCRFKWAEGMHDLDGNFQPAENCNQAANKARAALLAHIQRGAVPEGWQLVPKKPTPEMQFQSYMGSDGPNWPERQAIYKAMLTESQMHDLAGRLSRLAALSREANDASTAEHAARKRRNAADEKYAAEWAETVRQYGEANAPMWIESLRGPKPKIEVTA